VKWVENLQGHWAHANDTWGDKAVAIAKQKNILGPNSEPVLDRMGNLTDEETYKLKVIEGKIVLISQTRDIHQLIALLDDNPEVAEFMLLAHEDWREQTYREEGDIAKGVISNFKKEVDNFNETDILAFQGRIGSSQDLAGHVREAIDICKYNFDGGVRQVRDIKENFTEVEKNKFWYITSLEGNFLAARNSFISMFKMALILDERIQNEKKKKQDEVNQDLIKELQDGINYLVDNIVMDANPAVVEGILAANNQLREEFKEHVRV